MEEMEGLNGKLRETAAFGSSETVTRKDLLQFLSKCEGLKEVLTHPVSSNLSSRTVFDKHVVPTVMFLSNLDNSSILGQTRGALIVRNIIVMLSN